MQIEFVKEDPASSRIRTDEVQVLIVEMMELSRKRGRPAKEAKEVKYAA